MASDFPTSLDSLVVNQPYRDGESVIQAAELNKIQDAIDKMQTKLGVDNSAVATSMDFYRRKGYVKVADVKAAGAHGGTFTAGSWQTRTLNTEDSDLGNLCTLAANRITLAAGTYVCQIAVPARNCYAHVSRLYNVTGAAEVLRGTSEWSEYNATNKSLIVGLFTVAAGQALEVQHFGQATAALSGFGAGAIDTGNSVFTIAEFWKIA